MEKWAVLWYDETEAAFLVVVDQTEQERMSGTGIVEMV